MRTWLRNLSLVGLAMLLGGWVHVLSEEAFFSVDHNVRYSEIQSNPIAWLGTSIMLAGVIAENRTTPTGTTLEVLCYSRDERDAPLEYDESCGRFLARTGVELAADSFSAGRRVTLTGRVAGKEIFPGGELGAEVLVFEIGELYLWPLPEERQPYRHPYPWYDPWYDPFYDRPYWHRYPYGRW